jgi:hypothetical protein
MVNRLPPYLEETKLHNHSARRQAEVVARSVQRKWFEVKVPGKKGGGFDEPDQTDKLLGRYLGAFAKAGLPSSMANLTGGVTEGSFWEITVRKNIVLPNDARIATPFFAPQWAVTTSYAVGDVITSRVAKTGVLPLLRCVSSGEIGKSGNLQPSWPIQISRVVQDGDVLWQLIDWIVFYEIIGFDTGATESASTIIRVKEIS